MRCFFVSVVPLYTLDPTPYTVKIALVVMSLLETSQQALDATVSQRERLLY